MPKPTTLFVSVDFHGLTPRTAEAAAVRVAWLAAVDRVGSRLDAGAVTCWAGGYSTVRGRLRLMMVIAYLSDHSRVFPVKTATDYMLCGRRLAQMNQKHPASSGASVKGSPT
jgi:hypothetical protein